MKDDKFSKVIKEHDTEPHPSPKNEWNGIKQQIQNDLNTKKNARKSIFKISVLIPVAAICLLIFMNTNNKQGNINITDSEIESILEDGFLYFDIEDESEELYALD